MEEHALLAKAKQKIVQKGQNLRPKFKYSKGESDQCPTASRGTRGPWSSRN